MAKKQILFECQACGHQSAKWLGKCPNCGAWDEYIELSDKQIEVLKEINSKPATHSQSNAIPITEVSFEQVERYSSGDKELDLVLGGGIVQGSLTLIGGSPGVGKSTLLLKIAGNLAKEGKKVLYVSGEESSSQIKLRANRVDSNYPNLYLLSEIRLDTIFKELDTHSFEVLIIDSIQTIYSEKVASAPGSVSQVREITFELMRYGKDKNIAIFIIGHITKEGSIAGPRVLEHMVDTVLYFEGDSSRELRLLRGFKNRFGTTSEVGIFEMTKVGLVSAKDISKKFFTRGKAQAGSAITVLMEGSRPIVLEVQALVSDSGYPNPKRSATGYELNRLTMLLALLERKLDLPFNQYDVYINIAGGIKISETSADLAIIAAIISSYRNRPISKDTIFIGEVSLIGDVRDIFNLDLRLKEAKSQQFEKAVVPSLPLEKIEGIKCYNIDEVSKLIEWM
ncbi:DNA repair protein RadA [Sulfurospirillum diekertiae]|uniref:DNA repair protein RadA n=1 Tax=Sulfurospirillum diekertiae TaxID=1854492 RepID=A0A6G9VW73_9BACT|nr:DNA repair protein RadA [Sulfurospirillum diekertiae]QIR76931.1 DNA repair protein RadA [Sulfurospirillum diekertiae]QIR79548.1 DNA repair protein RadA [Sulfurospirillum diekertiae]